MAITFNLGRIRLGYSGIRIYSGIYSGYSAPGSRIAGMEIQVFRNENSSQTNAHSHFSNYSFPRFFPNERALNFIYLGKHIIRFVLINCLVILIYISIIVLFIFYLICN